MIVSHQHRFVFLKTRKTAGTSVEIALSKICGPDDIISRISPEDEELRAAAGGRGPQNHESPPLVRRAFNHMPAQKVRKVAGPRDLGRLLPVRHRAEPVGHRGLALLLEVPRAPRRPGRPAVLGVRGRGERRAARREPAHLPDRRRRSRSTASCATSGSARSWRRSGSTSGCPGHPSCPAPRGQRDPGATTASSTTTPPGTRSPSSSPTRSRSSATSSEQSGPGRPGPAASCAAPGSAPARTRPGPAGSPGSARAGAAPPPPWSTPR